MSANDPTLPSATARPAPALAAGVGDRYALIDPLGEGGMGVVWKAYDRVLDRAVALKILHEELLGAVHQERLIAEARAMARLSHRNVVTVYDAGERDGRTYLAMELVDGVAASTWLEAGRDWRQVVAVFAAAGEGVAAAHAAGIIHRDLKPANILVGDDGRVLVADFGVAGATSPRAALVRGGVTPLTASIAGTPVYMAPERLAGAPADARSDQFSFCVALFEALHGGRPFDGATIGALHDAMLGPPAAPARAVPPWLQAVVRRGLAADPAARYPSMRALLAALDRRPRRRRIVAAGGLAAVGAAVAIAVALRGGAAQAPCDGARHLAGVWDQDARARGRGAFAAADVAWREVERDLDDRAARWAAARVRTCWAIRDGELDEPAARRQLDCLDGQRRRMKMIVDGAMSGPNPKLPAAVRSLPDPESCEDPDRQAADAALTSGQAATDALAAWAALELGQLDEARAAADRAIAGARSAGQPPLLLAGALLVRGRVATAQHDLDQAEVTLTMAADLAAVHGAAELRADAWLALAGAQLDARRIDEAARTIELAAAALVDVPEGAPALSLSRSRAALYGMRGQPMLSARELNRAVKLAVVIHGDDSPAVAAVLDERATARRAADDHAGAAEDDAAAAAIRTLGVDRAD